MEAITYMELELDVYDIKIEESELLDNGLLALDNVNADTPFLDIGLFSDESWKGLRYYLLELNWCNTLGDLIERRTSIVTDLLGLTVFDEKKAQLFNRLIDVVIRCYHIEA